MYRLLLLFISKPIYFMIYYFILVSLLKCPWGIQGHENRIPIYLKTKK